MRAWIAVALLAGSWLLGLGYYQPANVTAWTLAVVVGSLLLAGGSARLAGGERWPLGASIAMLLPAVWFMPWPYRGAPLLVAIGAALVLAPAARRWPRAVGWGAIRAGVILLAQSLALGAYAAQTARSHDLPRPAASLLAALAAALGIDAAADGPSLAMHSMRRVHRMAVTWDLLVDPAALCFCAGGLALLALAWLVPPVAAGGLGDQRPTSACERRPLTPGPWSLTPFLWLTLVMAGWLPLRLAILVALYWHRAVMTDLASPLVAMNQFLSPWVLLVFLAGPVLLAWRFVRLPQGGPKGGQAAHGTQEETATAHGTQEETAAATEPRTAGHPVGRAVAAAAAVCVALGVATFVLTWDPVGQSKSGRVMVVERHSTWEPTTRPYSTTWYGELASYNYAVIYDYASRFFEMSQLLEKDKIDDDTLRQCDVLVIKTPTSPYEAGEVQAIERFVRRGGGLLLVGDHTNVFLSSSYLNDVARPFGFRYRHDLLFRIGSPYDQELLPPTVPHPVVQRLPPMFYAVSCSIEPGTLRGMVGWSGGRAVVQSSGLWSLPPDYHAENFHPQAEYFPEMRYGSFIQLWATRHGEGRVLAFTDSTIFSDFCIFQPGKAELMLGMLDWLSRSTPLDRAAVRLPVTVLLLLVAGALLAAGLVAGFGWEKAEGAWLIMLSAGVLGSTMGAMGVAAAHRRAMPPLEPVRPMTRVVIDRTVSQVPLSLGAYIQGGGAGYGLFEQWLPRLGCFTTRKSGRDVFSANALVVICPTGSVTGEYRQRLADYVAAGGKLLVIDSPESKGTTANSLLWPFGLGVEHSTVPPGKLALASGWPGIKLDGSCRITGGQPLLRLGDVPVAARTAYGKGSVMAVGFGSLWNDTNMGETWMQEPDAEMALRYDVLFAVIRSFLSGRPVMIIAAFTAESTQVKPSRKWKATAPTAKAPQSIATATATNASIRKTNCRLDKSGS